MSILKKALEGKLTKKELEKMRASFDVIGNIAVMEVTRGLEPKEKIIGETLLGILKHVDSVFKKGGGHFGRYRRQKLVLLAGKEDKATVHKESNSRFLLDVEKCYFSPRLSHDRLMVAKQVKPKEKVLVMFSGVAPYPIVIARNTKACKIVGVEMNPVAHKYGLENVNLNKVEDRVELYKGDAADIVPKLGKFDRILMPLPKTAGEFLQTSLKACKKGAVVHFYCFSSDEDLVKQHEKIKRECKKVGKKCKILGSVKAGNHKPRVFRYRVDFKAN